MNLHYRYTRSATDTREMERSLLSLFELYQRLSVDSLNESLTAGRMSDFLFEADEAAVEASAKEARDAAMRSLDELEQTGQTLNNSKAIAQFVKELRQRLASVVLDSGKSRSVKDFAGITIKQISYIGDTLSQAIKSIDSAIDAMIASMKTMKIDFESEDKREVSIADIIQSYANNNKGSGITVDKFKQGIQQKMLKSTEGRKGFFSTIMSLLKGASVEKITVSGEQFANDLLTCTSTQIEEYLNGPLPKRVEGPPPAGEQVKNLSQISGSDAKSIENSQPPGTKVSKFTKDEWTELVKQKGSSPEDLKQDINTRAEKMGISGGIIEGRQNKFHSRSTVLTERWEKLAGIKGNLQ